MSDLYEINLKTRLKYTPKGYIINARGETPMNENCCERMKKRSEEEIKSLSNRLNRIEGQIRGIRGMLEKDAYCTDIITQVAAANAALNAFNRELMASHIRSCVKTDVERGDDASLEEMITLMQKLMK